MAIWVALVVLAVTATSAAGAPPQPDAAPQAPAVAPDPVPGTAPAQEPTEPAEQQPPPAQSQPPAAAPTQQPSTPKPREPQTRPAVAHHRPSTKPRQAGDETDPARASSLVQIRALLPGDQANTDSSPRLFLLAAGALLALVLASGSMVSVASRAMKGQLR